MSARRSPDLRSVVRRRSVRALFVALAAAGWIRAASAAPSPLAGDLFSFPGSVPNPGSAASAGLALADRWLGEEPFTNPAVRPGWRVTLSPAALHMDRQDLAARNRNFDQTSVFFDGAGISVGLPALGPIAVTGYAYQPVLRFEQTAYTRGLTSPDPLTPPAVVETEGRARETHAGLALSGGAGSLRAGLGVEWLRRDDRYFSRSQGPDPGDGTRRLEFSGDGVAFQLGVAFARDSTTVKFLLPNSDVPMVVGNVNPTPGALVIGAAARFQPALRFDAVHTEALNAGASQETIRVERGSVWEAGLSARVALTPTFRALGAIGGRSAERWDAFGVRTGAGWEWKLAGEMHDPQSPWTARIGIGQERQPDAPEPDAGVLSVGFGWRFSEGTLDLGAVRRTVTRPGRPHAFDDRVVLSITVPR